ncbi:MAG: hypothetical protein ABF521_03675 [Acetobacter orientalis]|uniref:hypothetical protein n=1 Tax=Acetobacter orientalis TaxID=146474 RepID=UPI0039E7A22A
MAALSFFAAKNKVCKPSKWASALLIGLLGTGLALSTPTIGRAQSSSETVPSFVQDGTLTVCTSPPRPPHSIF